MPYSLPDHSVQVLVLQMKPHCLLPHIWAAGSVAPCFDLHFSQRTVSSPSIVLSQCGRSKVPTAQLHHPAAYTFFICTWHTLQSLLLWCTASSQNIPLTSLPISQYTLHKMRRLTIQLCISIHHHTMTDWCIMNWNGRGRKWSWHVWSTTATFAWRNREKPM